MIPVTLCLSLHSSISNMIKIQKIDFPLDCKVVRNDFYNYDPVSSFKVADSIKYLSEDLLQCSFPEEDMIIDLGWYGDVVSNKGEFKILLIQYGNWEIPFNEILSKSVVETKEILEKIFQYYSTVKPKEDLDNI
jgi:hypothetical protein